MTRFQKALIAISFDLTAVQLLLGVGALMSPPTTSTLVALSYWFPLGVYGFVLFDFVLSFWMLITAAWHLFVPGNKSLTKFFIMTLPTLVYVISFIIAYVDGLTRSFVGIVLGIAIYSLILILYWAFT